MTKINKQISKNEGYGVAKSRSDLRCFGVTLNTSCGKTLYKYIALILSFAISLKHVSVKNMPKIINEGGDKEFFTPLCTHGVRNASLLLI